jgi:glycosyltransferase involved in cell wall biosynthesis
LVGRSSLSIDSADRLILAVGNLYRVKGHDVLVDAAKILVEDESLPPWRIAIAGRGEEEELLTERIVQQGLSERIQLLGLRNDIPDLLAASDAWVMPSRSEGLPMALLEAMLAGLPIIATDVGGICGAIVRGRSGWIVPPEDPPALAAALAEMLRDATWAARMGVAGKATAEANYGASSMVNAYLNTYREAVGG